MSDSFSYGGDCDELYFSAPGGGLAPIVNFEFPVVPPDTTPSGDGEISTDDPPDCSTDSKLVLCVEKSC